ncbi:MAG TPA: 50S ribosomal protein L17 [Candidatus Paceibacterota bacterium]|nr:50S ribosomal protein L17 [Candidatus Paceibacterota bacterium]
MRHLNKGKKLHRKTDQRKALVKILTYNLVMKERITTTKAKASMVKPYLERLITRAKKQDVNALRYVLSKVPEKAANKIYYDLAKRYIDRPGGYTRVLKIEKPRVKDSAKMVILELV